MADRGRKAFPVTSHLLDERWQKHSYDLHRQRLKEIKPRIDDKEPETTKIKIGRANNPKRAQQEANRQAEIDLENQVLLQKLVKIKTFDSSKVFKPWLARSTFQFKEGLYYDIGSGVKCVDHMNLTAHSSPRSISYYDSRPASAPSFRAQQAYLELLGENTKLLRAIETIQPFYSVDKMEQQHVENVQHERRLSNYRGPESARFEPMGRAVSASRLRQSDGPRGHSAMASRRASSANRQRPMSADPAMLGVHAERKEYRPMAPQTAYGAPPPAYVGRSGILGAVLEGEEGGLSSSFREDPQSPAPAAAAEPDWGTDGQVHASPSSHSLRNSVDAGASEPEWDRASVRSNVSRKSTGSASGKPLSPYLARPPSGGSVRSGGAGSRRPSSTAHLSGSILDNAGLHSPATHSPVNSRPQSALSSRSQPTTPEPAPAETSGNIATPASVAASPRGSTAGGRSSVVASRQASQTLSPQASQRSVAAEEPPSPSPASAPLSRQASHLSAAPREDVEAQQLGLASRQASQRSMSQQAAEHLSPQPSTHSRQASMSQHTLSRQASVKSVRESVHEDEPVVASRQGSVSQAQAPGLSPQASQRSTSHAQVPDLSPQASQRSMSQAQVPDLSPQASQRSVRESVHDEQAQPSGSVVASRQASMTQELSPQASQRSTSHAQVPDLSPQASQRSMSQAQGPDLSPQASQRSTSHAQVPDLSPQASQRSISQAQVPDLSPQASVHSRQASMSQAQAPALSPQASTHSRQASMSQQAVALSPQASQRSVRESVHDEQVQPSGSAVASRQASMTQAPALSPQASQRSASHAQVPDLSPQASQRSMSQAQVPDLSPQASVHSRQASMSQQAVPMSPQASQRSMSHAQVPDLSPQASQRSMSQAQAPALSPQASQRSAAAPAEEVEELELQPHPSAGPSRQASGLAAGSRPTSAKSQRSARAGSASGRASPLGQSTSDIPAAVVEAEPSAPHSPAGSVSGRSQRSARGASGDSGELGVEASLAQPGSAAGSVKGSQGAAVADEEPAGTQAAGEAYEEAVEAEPAPEPEHEEVEPQLEVEAEAEEDLEPGMAEALANFNDVEDAGDDEELAAAAAGFMGNSNEE